MPSPMRHWRALAAATTLCLSGAIGAQGPETSMPVVDTGRDDVPAVKQLLERVLSFPNMMSSTLPDPVLFGVTIERGDIDSAKRWLDKGLDPDFVSDTIGTGLMIAAWEGNVPMMELFVGRGANVNFTNGAGEQAILLAAWKGHLAAVKWLVERGAQLNRPGNQWSALHYAAFAGQHEVSRYLLDLGADINARSPNKSTPLMMAAREGREALAQTLIEHGADARLRNDWGDNAATWAMRYDHVKIAKLVSNAAEFAQAAALPKNAFGTPTRSERAPDELESILRETRLAESQAKSAEQLKRRYAEALAKARLPAKPALKNAKIPTALVITAKRASPAEERVELLFDRDRTGAPIGAGEASLIP